MVTKTYTIEHAKSGRSGCKKCNEKIPKGELRIGTHDEDTAEYSMTSWCHVKCFNLPRVYAAGPEKCTVEDFVDNYLRDNTGETEGEDPILEDPDKKAEVVAMIEEKQSKKKKVENKDDFIGKLKREYEAMVGDEEGEEGAKAPASPKRAKMLDEYGEVRKIKVDQLKEELKWNKQLVKGTKDFLLAKIIDGRLNGRLAICPGCGGALKFNEDTGVDRVFCNGSFDEDMQAKIPCSLSYPASTAPRWTPWFKEEPTEEEKEEISRVYESAQEHGMGAIAPDGKVDKDSNLGKLMEKAKTLEIDVSDGAATAKTAKAMTDFLKDDDTLDLPEKGLKMFVGNSIVRNPEKTAGEIVKLVADHYGFKEENVEKKANKEASAASVCKEPKNASLMAAFAEYAQLCFKKQDKFKGAAFNKVVTAIKELPFEVTEENAMKLGKPGASKLPGVGKGSAEKMLEFVTTGTILKMEQLREELGGDA